MKIIFVFLWLCFILASLVSAKFNNLGSRVFYRVTAVWLGIFFYLFLAACVYAGLILIPPIAPALLATGQILFFAAILVSIYGIIHANTIQITPIKITLPNLGGEWLSRKAVLLSDLHLGQARGEKFSARIVAKLQKLKPDIIFLAGDLYDGVAVNAEEVIASFRELRVPLDIYFITGNHEEFSDEHPYLEAVKKIGFKTLIDEKATIDGLQIVGVDYRHASKKAVFDGILQKIQIDPKLPSILLKHEPADLDIALKNGISLQLSGHTHKAQMFPLNFFTRLIYGKFEYGLHSLGAMQVYTSSGVGTWGPPLRVGSRAEIVEIGFN